MKATLLAAALLIATAWPAVAQLPAGIDTTGIDKAVKPGDDFDDYANGAWRAKAEIPADRSSIGTFLSLRDVSDERQKGLIAELLKTPAAPGSEPRKVADYYSAYLDSAGIEARGIAPIKPAIDEIAAIRDRPALVKALGKAVRADVDPLNTATYRTTNLVGLFVSQSFDDPKTTVPYVLPGGIGLPDRDYYLSDKPQMAALRTGYQTYIATMLKLAGFPDAEARAAAVMALETKIAKAHPNLVDAQDPVKANNPWSRAEFATKAPGLDWDAFWTAARLPKQQGFIIWSPGAVTGMAALVGSEPIEVWKDWLAFHKLDQVADVLPRPFEEARFALYGKALTGAAMPRPRAIRAIGATNAALGDAFGKIYVQHYFPAASKTDIKAMVSGILKAFDTRVSGLDWMAPATKAEARRKIETTRVGIGYPDRWADYTALVVKADDPVGNRLRASLAASDRQLAKIGRPVDKDEWWMFPQTVNAVNLPLQNGLNFPAAILQPPFYDAKRDAAANYGGIGATIGHEVSHSFDNSGAVFDADGRLRNWWTPADFKHFEESGAALAKQYDAYEPLPGLHINGKQVLGENIADLAGLTATVEAYHASLGGKPAPVIDGMTGDQRLFLAFAQTWRSKIREQSLRARIATDGHSPDRWRAFTVRNLDAWYAAFGVKPGDKMYLPPEQRVKVW